MTVSSLNLNQLLGEDSLSAAQAIYIRKLVRYELKKVNEYRIRAVVTIKEEGSWRVHNLYYNKMDESKINTYKGVMYEIIKWRSLFVTDQETANLIIKALNPSADNSYRNQLTLLGRIYSISDIRSVNSQSLFKVVETLMNLKA